MSDSVTSLRVLSWQLFVVVMLASLLLTLLLAGIQLYPLYPQQLSDLLARAPHVLMVEAVKVAVPALLLFWLVKRRLLVPLRQRAQQGEERSSPLLPRNDRGMVLMPMVDGVGQWASCPDSSGISSDGQHSWGQLLFAEAPDAVLILDADSHEVLDANPAALRLLIRDRDGLRGVSIDHLCPDTLDVLRRFLQRVQRDGSAWSAELHCRDALGAPLLLDIKASLVARAGSRVILATLRTLHDRKDMQARMVELAYHDALTGLPNRVLLRDRLEMLVARSQRSDCRGAVLILDVDNFKTVNDSLGHPAGDLLIQELAGRFNKVLHEDDTIARLGGDEFVVLPQQLQVETAPVLEHALAIVDQLRSVLERPFVVGEHEIHVTISIGVAVFPNDGSTVDELLRRADSAMYQAKALGRDATHFYSPEMEERVARRLTMGSALRRALRNEEFVLDFQPQWSFQDNQMIGCEALVRWERPDHGRVQPLEFLSYMEDCGLLTELGFWVLDRACQYWRDGRRQGLIDAHFRMAVNISAGQFASAAFVQMVESVLQENHMLGCNLELEITEQALVGDLANAAAKITALQSQGVSFAIDDFGTGYSSLAYLQQLPVDCLKIDRGFVKLVGKDDRGAGLVDVIISIARKLNLRVVAEGVEHESQAIYLRKQGCDVAQGYLFGRPVSWETLHQLTDGAKVARRD